MGAHMPDQVSSGNHLTTLFGTERSIVEQTPEEKLSDTVTRCVHLHPLSDSAFELAFELNGYIYFLLSTEEGG